MTEEQTKRQAVLMDIVFAYRDARVKKVEADNATAKALSEQQDAKVAVEKLESQLQHQIDRICFPAWL